MHAKLQQHSHTSGLMLPEQFERACYHSGRGETPLTAANCGMGLQ